MSGLRDSGMKEFLLCVLIFIAFVAFTTGICLTIPYRRETPECSDLELAAIEWKIREEWGAQGIRDADEARSERHALASDMSCKLAKEDE